MVEDKKQPVCETGIKYCPLAFIACKSADAIKRLYLMKDVLKIRFQRYKRSSGKY